MRARALSLFWGEERWNRTLWQYLSKTEQSLASSLSASELLELCALLALGKGQRLLVF